MMRTGKKPQISPLRYPGLGANQVTNATAPTFGEITNACNAQEGELAAIFHF
jgi:hypothetical protein